RSEAACGRTGQPGGFPRTYLRHRERSDTFARLGSLSQLWAGTNSVQCIFRQVESQSPAGVEPEATARIGKSIGPDSHYSSLRAGFEGYVGARPIPFGCRRVERTSGKTAAANSRRGSVIWNCFR